MAGDVDYTNGTRETLEVRANHGAAIDAMLRLSGTRAPDTINLREGPVMLVDDAGYETRTEKKDGGTGSSRTRANDFVAAFQVSQLVANGWRRSRHGFHVGARGSSWGWISVILFFSLAGANMAGAIDRSESLFLVWAIPSSTHGVPSRTRVVPPRGHGSERDGVERRSSVPVRFPLFLQNFTPILFDYAFPLDWVFGPLWFLSALMQLQLIVFASRRLLVRSPPLIVAGGAVVFGVIFRCLAAIVLGGSLAEIDGKTGEFLYNLPFTHIEWIMLGFLIGRGHLAGLGRNLPAVALVAASAIC